MIRPRALMFAGRVRVDARWFPAAAVGEYEARRRILLHYEQGASVRRAPDGYLLLLPSPRWLIVEQSIGFAVQRRDNAWVALPLRDDELAALAAPRDSFVFGKEGHAHIGPADSLIPVDLSDWIDVSHFRAIEGSACAAPPKPAAEPHLAASSAATEIGSILGDTLPPKAADRAALLEALETTSKGPPRGTGSAAAGHVTGGPIPGVADVLGKWLARWFGLPPQRSIGDAQGGAGQGRGSSGGTAPAAPHKPGFLRRMLDRFIVASPLSALIGRRQAQYIERTLQMFEQGKIDEALRHAIPFGALPGAPKPPSLHVPSPRAELRLTAMKSAEPSTSLNLGDQLYERFKELYRKAARDLEARGRIEEAAYVLLDLLGETAEGIALLERHGKYTLAAQIAEGRDPEAGLVIRLWFLAGEPGKATAVARRTGAFADAVSRLQDNHPELAQRLRVLWADRLASAGDLAAAIDAIWPVHSARHLARHWLDLAIDFGGRPGARLLARKLELFGAEQQAHDEVHATVHALLQGDDATALELRDVLGEAWQTLPEAVLTRTRPLGGALGRRLLHDAYASGRPNAANALLKKLGDPLLRADAHGRPVPEPTSVAAPRSGVFTRHERGLIHATDAIVLENGRLLVALGDAGMRLLDSDGKVLRRYEHPVQRLVRGDYGNRAIGLIRRGETTTLTQIDLVSGRAHRWCDARFRRHVDSFDGTTWFVTTDDAVVAVDTQCPGFEALWRVGQIEHPILALARDPKNLVLCLDVEEQNLLEVWRYELSTNGPVLRQRRHLTIPDGMRPVLADTFVSPQAHVVTRTYDPVGERRSSYLGLGKTDRVVTAVVSGTGPFMPRASDGLVLGADEQSIEIFSASLDTLTAEHQVPRLRLEGANHMQLRMRDASVLVADDLGRIVELGEDLNVRRFWRT